MGPNEQIWCNLIFFVIWSLWLTLISIYPWFEAKTEQQGQKRRLSLVVFGYALIVAGQTGKRPEPSVKMAADLPPQISNWWTAAASRNCDDDGRFTVKCESLENSIKLDPSRIPFVFPVCVSACNRDHPAVSNCQFTNSIRKIHTLARLICNHVIAN